MTIAIVTTNVAAAQGQDQFAVVVNGAVITTHPSLKGATKLAARFNATGSL